MNYFVYNGISSEEFKSLIVSELPAIVRSSRRYDRVEIPGRDGALYRDLGYSDVQRTMVLAVKNTTEIDNIFAWLTGEGYAVFSNEPNKKYYVRWYDAINLNRLFRFGKASVKIMCSPYKYLANEEYTYGYNIENKGTVPAQPYIKITGSGSTVLHIDNKAICTLKIEDGYLEIDSEKQECSKAGVLKNRCMLGDFPIIEPGEHVMSFQGGTVTECKTLVRSRFV